jgi:hypothetical protein
LFVHLVIWICNWVRWSSLCYKSESLKRNSLEGWSCGRAGRKQFWMKWKVDEEDKIRE